MIGLTMRSVTWNRFYIKNLWLIPCFCHLWSEVTCKLFRYVYLLQHQYSAMARVSASEMTRHSMRCGFMKSRAALQLLTRKPLKKTPMLTKNRSQSYKNAPKISDLIRLPGVTYVLAKIPSWQTFTTKTKGAPTFRSVNDRPSSGRRTSTQQFYRLFLKGQRSKNGETAECLFCALMKAVHWLIKTLMYPLWTFDSWAFLVILYKQSHAIISTKQYSWLIDHI